MSARCVKCGSDNILIRYHAEGPDCGQRDCRMHPSKPERLEHHCRICQYGWTTEPLDAAPVLANPQEDTDA